MVKQIKGYRLTAFKSKRLNLVKEKIENYFDVRKINTKVMKGDGYHYIYVEIVEVTEE